jgi:hypothetical protein
MMAVWIPPPPPIRSHKRSFQFSKRSLAVLVVMAVLLAGLAELIEVRRVGLAIEKFWSTAPSAEIMIPLVVVLTTPIAFLIAAALEIPVGRFAIVWGAIVLALVVVEALLLWRDFDLGVFDGVEAVVTCLL